MLTLVRSNSVDPDVRIEKYFRFLDSSIYKYEYWGWERVKGNSLNPKNNLIKVRLFRSPSKFGSGSQNTIKILFFQLWLFVSALFRPGKGHIYHLCDLDSAAPIAYALYLRNLIGLRDEYLYDIFDFYIDAFSVPKKLRNQFLKIEKFVISRAVQVILPALYRLDQLAQHGITINKYEIIENSNDINLNFSDECKNDRGFQEKDRKIKLGYVGILSDDRSLKRLTKFVMKHKEFSLDVIGFGKLEGFFRSLDSDNVTFHGKKTHYEAMNFMKGCDIYLALYDPTNPNHSYAAPNKMFEGLQLGKPILIYDYNINILSLKYAKNSIAIRYPLVSLDANWIVEELKAVKGNILQDTYLKYFSEATQSRKYLKIIERIKSDFTLH